MAIGASKAIEAVFSLRTSGGIGRFIVRIPGGDNRNLAISHRIETRQQLAGVDPGQGEPRMPLVSGFVRLIKNY